jgi:hypothetical protein
MGSGAAGGRRSGISISATRRDALVARVSLILVLVREVVCQFVRLAPRAELLLHTGSMHQRSHSQPLGAEGATHLGLGHDCPALLQLDRVVAAKHAQQVAHLLGLQGTAVVEVDRHERIAQVAEDLLVQLRHTHSQIPLRHAPGPTLGLGMAQRRRTFSPRSGASRPAGAAGAGAGAGGGAMPSSTSNEGADAALRPPRDTHGSQCGTGGDGARFAAHLQGIFSHLPAWTPHCIPGNTWAPESPGLLPGLRASSSSDSSGSPDAGLSVPEPLLAAAARHPDPPTKVGLATPSGYPKERARTAGCARTVAPPGRVYLVLRARVPNRERSVNRAMHREPHALFAREARGILPRTRGSSSAAQASGWRPTRSKSA